jgi:hypothetical protein
MFNHHTKTKGDLGVLKAKLDLFQKGFLILSPETEHAPFDLVAYKDNSFVRIQVKYREVVDGKIEIKGRTSWADRNGTHERDYDLSAIDVFCVYVPSIDSCFYFKAELFEKNKTINFRVEAPKNNQKHGIRLVSDYSEVP